MTLTLATPTLLTPAPPPPAGIMPRLRAETRDLHDAIEQNPGFCRLMARDLTQDDYGVVIGALWSFHGAVEPAVERALGPLAEDLALGTRTRRHLLAADLAVLGRRPEPAAIALPLPSPAAALGCLYVLEGSRRGGAVIAKRLAAQLGLGPDTGGAYYFSALSPDQRGGWASLTAVLEAVAGGPATAAADAMVAAARDTFTTLDAHVGAVWRRFRQPCAGPALAPA